MKHKFRKAVFIVVYRKENKTIKYLVLKRAWHWKGWEFPKGGVEDGESYKKAVFREVVEETGNESFDIIDHNIRGRYNYSRVVKDRGGIVGQTWKLYSAKLRSKKVKIDEKEHEEYLWLNYGGSLKKLRWPNQKRCLGIVNKSLTTKN